MMGGAEIPILLGIGAAGSVIQGTMGLKAAREEQGQIALDQKREQAAATQRGVEIRKQMLQTLGAQEAAFGARGLSGQGTPNQILGETNRNGLADLRINRANSAATISQLGRQYSQAGMRGISSFIGGVSNAAMGMYSGMNASASIGKVPTSSAVGPPRPLFKRGVW